MAKLSLRRYDVQAVVSVYISILAILPLIALAFFIAQQLDFSQWVFYYGKLRKLAILGSGLAALGLAAIGFGLGLNSAGQRRNDKPMMSWLGFFISAIVICLTLVLLYFFRERGESVLV